jgi:hypothetical protein
MRKKPFTAGELFNEIIKDIETPSIVDFARPSSKGDTPITYYAFNLYTRVMYGSNEGIYADVCIYGRFDIEPGYRDLCIGTIKSLNTDDESVKKIYDYCAEIFLKGSKFIEDNLDELTWLGYRIEYSPTYQTEVASTDIIPKSISTRIKRGYNPSELKIMDLSTRKYINEKPYIEAALEIIEEDKKYA